MSIRARQHLNGAIQKNIRQQQNQQAESWDTARSNYPDADYVLPNVQTSEAGSVVPKQVYHSHFMPNSQHQDTYSTSQHNARPDSMHSAWQGTVSYAEYVPEAPADDAKSFLTNAQGDAPCHNLGPEQLPQPRRSGSEVYDFPGSDGDIAAPQRRQSLIITLQSAQYSDHRMQNPKKAAPTAEMTGVARAPMTPMATGTRQEMVFHGNYPVNGLPRISKQSTYDDNDAMISEKTMKGKKNISGFPMASPGVEETEVSRQRALPAADVLRTKSKINGNGPHIRLASVEGATSDPSESPTDQSYNDNEGQDPTYKPGTARKAQRATAKRSKDSTMGSKAAKKPRYESKRKIGNKQPLSPNRNLELEAHSKSVTLPAATKLPDGLKDGASLPTGASDEHQHQKSASPSSADVQAEAALREIAVKIAIHDQSTKPAIDAGSALNGAKSDCRSNAIQNDQLAQASPSPCNPPNLSRTVALACTQHTESPELPGQIRENPPIADVSYLLVNKAISRTRARFLPSLTRPTLDEMTLCSVFDHAGAAVAAGSQVGHISLTLRAYEYKNFPELTVIVNKDDYIGFKRVKLEFVDSIREYMEEGVMQFRILLEVNPTVNPRRVDQ